MGEGWKQSQVALTTKLKIIYSTLFSMFWVWTINYGFVLLIEFTSNLCSCCVCACVCVCVWDNVRKYFAKYLAENLSNFEIISWWGVMLYACCSSELVDQGNRGSEKVALFPASRAEHKLIWLKRARPDSLSFKGLIFSALMQLQLVSNVKWSWCFTVSKLKLTVSEMKLKQWSVLGNQGSGWGRSDFLAWRKG